MEEKTKNYTIFSQRLAGYLMMNGQVLINMKRNKIDNDKKVFYFKDSAELRSLIEDFQNKQTK